MPANRSPFSPNVDKFSPDPTKSHEFSRILTKSQRLKRETQGSEWGVWQGVRHGPLAIPPMPNPVSLFRNRVRPAPQTPPPWYLTWQLHPYAGAMDERDQITQRKDRTRSFLFTFPSCSRVLLIRNGVALWVFVNFAISA